MAYPRQRRGAGRARQDVSRSPEQRLEIACTERAGLTLIALAGSFDIYTARGFAERVGHYDPAAVQLVIDLARVTLLDSAGLGALVSLRNSAHREGRQVGVICPQPRLERIFVATGLRRCFVVGPDLATVRAGLARRRGEGRAE